MISTRRVASGQAAQRSQRWRSTEAELLPDEYAGAICRRASRRTLKPETLSSSAADRHTLPAHAIPNAGGPTSANVRPSPREQLHRGMGELFDGARAAARSVLAAEQLIADKSRHRFSDEHVEELRERQAQATSDLAGAVNDS